MPTDPLVLSGLLFGLMVVGLFVANQILLMWTGLRLKRAEARKTLVLARVVELEAQVKLNALKATDKATAAELSLALAKVALEQAKLKAATKEQEAIAAKHVVAIKESEAAASLPRQIHDVKVQGEQARQAAALEIERAALHRKHGTTDLRWSFDQQEGWMRIKLECGSYVEDCLVATSPFTRDSTSTNLSINSAKNSMMQRYLAFKNSKNI